MYVSYHPLQMNEGLLHMHVSDVSMLKDCLLTCLGSKEEMLHFNLLTISKNLTTFKTYFSQKNKT